METLLRNEIKPFHEININKSFLIDNQTRKDLSLDSFYEKFNNTKTSYGDNLFYHKINSQTKNIEQTENMIKDLNYLSNNGSTIKSLANGLQKIGKQFTGNIVKDLWNGLSYKPKFFGLIPFWFFLGPSILIVLYSTIGQLALWGLLVLVIINIVLFLITYKKISSAAGSLNYLIKTLIVSPKLKQDDYFNNLLSFNIKLNRILKYRIFLKDGVGSSIIGKEMSSSILDYVRIFLCAELFAYYKIYKHVNKNIQDIRKIIEDVGYLDFIVNSAKIVEENITSYPEFRDLNNIDFEEMSHPLIDNCSPYNFEVSNSMIITGMNMAGKSTFMKSVAINQILAISFGFTFSKKFTTSNYLVVTSMKIEDDLENNKSKYYMEAERLLQIQNLLKENKILCIIDEILTGTNTVDRIEASIGILRNYIRNKSSLIFAATHDKDIAEDLYPQYSNYYFDGELGDKEIIYDYKIKKGIVVSRNALQLLKKLGIEVLSKQNIQEKIEI